MQLNIGYKLRQTEKSLFIIGDRKSINIII